MAVFLLMQLIIIEIQNIADFLIINGSIFWLYSTEYELGVEARNRGVELLCKCYSDSTKHVISAGW